MINFLTDCAFCKDSGVFSTIYLGKKIMGAVFIIIPIILIVLIILDFAKNVVAGKEDDMKKNKNLAIKRIIYAVAIFFVPTIVNIFMQILYRNVDSSSEASFLECWANANDVNKVNQCNADAIATEMATDILKQSKTNEILNKYKEAVDNKKGSGGITVNTGDDNSNNNNDNSSSNTDSNLPSTINNYTVYTGDSRTNLMCYYTNLAPLGGGSNNGHEKCIVGPGYAHYYFETKILKQLVSELDAHNDANIVLASWGTNDVSPKIFPNSEVTYPGTYYSKMYYYNYKYLAEKYPNAKFVVVSVLYFDESKHGAIMYRLKNMLVDNFNKNMKENVKGISNIVYCDITSTLGTSLNSPDGIHHYGADNNQKILDEIKKCI